MSSDQTTDVSRTSSFQAQSSFEDARQNVGLAVPLGGHYQQQPGAGSVAASVGAAQGRSSLAEHLARVEDKVC